MIDFQAIQEAAKTAATGGGSKLLEGGIGGAIMVAGLRVMEAAIQKWRPRKNGNGNGRGEKPGKGIDCITHGNKIMALETDQENSKELLKEVRDDIKIILGRLPRR